MTLKRALILSMVPVMFAVVGVAQTEVRHAVALPSYKDLKFPALPPPKIPAPVEFTLSNGMRVFLLEDHELPLVTGGALVRTGNLFDPANKKGLAQLTGEVLRSGGTKAKSGDQVDEDLENVAAAVESQIGETSATLTFSCLKENTDQVLRVFKDFLTAAEFRQDKVDLSLTQSRSGISRRNDDANGVADREFASVIYGRNTPYGWETEYADLDNIKRQDMVDFYHRYYFPSNILLEIYGDFSADDLKGKLEQLLGGWKYTQPAVPQFPKVEAKAAPGIFLAAKPDVTQTFFNVGHLGGILRDKDYPALEVAAQILGGGFSSRLFRSIRTAHGWAYNVGADWGANYEHPGIFRISGSTQSAHTVDTLKAVREELDKMRTAEVTDQELQTAKDTVLNGFVFFFDRPSKTLNRLLQYEYHHYPRDFIFQYQKAIGAVTKADVLRVAKEYFRPQDLTYVAVGNPAEFGTPLTSLGKVEPIDLTIPEPKKESAAVSMDPAALEKGKQLLARVQQAMGGADKLAAVKDVVYHAQVAVETPGAVMKVKQTNSFLAPTSLRQDIEAPFGKQSVYSDGTTGWIASIQGMMGLSPAVVKQVRGEVFRQMVRLAVSDRQEGVTVSYTGDGTLEIAAKDGEHARLVVDEKTGMPLKVIYPADSGQGEVAQEYSDWREVGGIRLPYAWVIQNAGKKFATVTVDDYKVNSGLTVDTLSKKP
jgi:zinc protease